MHYIIMYVAAQMGLLGKVIALILAKYVPINDEHWQNYILLLLIIDYILAPKITEDEVAYLQTMITDHHKKFIELYPNCTVTPKMHYMIHVPCIILQ